jgi:phosphoribosyl-ATP pyrophosphohydrolase
VTCNKFVLVPTDDPTAPEPGLRTIRYDQFVAQLLKADTAPMMKLHAALGVCGEAGELADAVKKEIIYGKPMDRAHIVEELGDLWFYMQAVQNLYEIHEQEILQHNADKLAKRYASLTFSSEAAIARADKNGSTEN